MKLQQGQLSQGKKFSLFSFLLQFFREHFPPSVNLEELTPSYQPFHNPLCKPHSSGLAQTVIALREVSSQHRNCSYLKTPITDSRWQTASLEGIWRCSVKTNIWMLSESLCLCCGSVWEAKSSPWKNLESGSSG